jgi:hypothetical protein
MCPASGPPGPHLACKPRHALTRLQPHHARRAAARSKHGQDACAAPHIQHAGALEQGRVEGEGVPVGLRARLWGVYVGVCATTEAGFSNQREGSRGVRDTCCRTGVIWFPGGGWLGTLQQQGDRLSASIQCLHRVTQPQIESRHTLLSLCHHPVLWTQLCAAAGGTQGPTLSPSISRWMSK